MTTFFINAITKSLRQLLGSAFLWLVSNGYLTDAQLAHILLVVATFAATILAHYGNYYLTKLKREVAKVSDPSRPDEAIKAEAWDILISRLKAFFSKGKDSDS